MRLPHFRSRASLQPSSGSHSAVGKEKHLKRTQIDNTEERTDFFLYKWPLRGMTAAQHMA